MRDTESVAYATALRDWTFRLPRRLRSAALRDVARLAGIAPDVSTLAKLATDRSSPPRRRAEAVWAIGVLRPKGAGEMLTKLLAEDVRNEVLLWELAKAIVQVAPRGAVRSLIGDLRHGVPARRRMAAWTLGMLGARTARHDLERVLAHDRSSSVRDEAAEALAAVGDASSLPVLIAATRDASAEVRYAAAFALGQIGHPQALPPLRRLLKDAAVSDNGHTVRAAARRAILQILRKRARSGHGLVLYKGT